MKHTTKTYSSSNSNPTPTLLQQLKAAEDNCIKATKQANILRAILFFISKIDIEISNDTSLCASLLQQHSLLSTSLQKKVESRDCVLQRQPQAVEECIKLYLDNIEAEAAAAEKAAAEAAAAETAAAEAVAAEAVAAETAAAEAKKREMEVYINIYIPL